MLSYVFMTLLVGNIATTICWFKSFTIHFNPQLIIRHFLIKIIPIRCLTCRNEVEELQYQLNYI